MSHKRGIWKQCWPRSDAAEGGIWSGSTLFAIRSDNSINHGYTTNHGYNKQLPVIPYIRNRPVQRVEVEEYTRHKRVKLNRPV